MSFINQRNGSERLNDIHILDTATSTWTCPHVAGVLPHPRAGMTLTALRGRLYLFGGSGTSSKCFQDLQILDRSELAWLDVTQHEPSNHQAGRHRYESFEGDGYFEQRWSFGGYVSCIMLTVQGDNPDFLLLFLSAIERNFWRSYGYGYY